MFDRVVKDINCDKVLVDDKEAVYKATSHLIKSGRKKIALVSTISNLTVGKSRIAGYKQALNENGIEFLESYVVSSSEEGIKKETDLFLSNNQTDAIIALDIQSSLSGLKSVKEYNYDYILVSNNDIDPFTMDLKKLDIVKKLPKDEKTWNCFVFLNSRTSFKCTTPPIAPEP